jgi:hypothetical protein
LPIKGNAVNNKSIVALRQKEVVNKVSSSRKSFKPLERKVELPQAVIDVEGTKKLFE